MTDEVGPFLLGSSCSAICRVPVEIWAEIFVFVKMIDVAHISILYHPRQAPWNLSYVCSMWRQIAVSHSRLWSYHPLFLERECLSLKDPVSLLKLVLTRSLRPRGIYFFEDNSFADNNPPPSCGPFCKC
ncbi:hypothetical protein BDZ89DRAFT_679777 [Hymenopellis radicata]|nr:hypothetical protein BDZ89DRAFT_679777 [Hymenopellis radicata]